VKKFDWIRLKSGEWLKGEIKELRNDKFEFDSDELDDLTFDWEDVVEVRSPRMNTCLFEGHVKATGTLLIRDNVVLVGGKETQRFARQDLLTIAAGEEKEVNYWSGKVSIGLTGRSGNTDQTDLSTVASVMRRTALSRLALSYNGDFSKVDGEETINSHRANAKYDISLTRRLYLTPLSAEYYRDIFQNIEHRVVPAAGGGYHLVDRSGLTWDAELAAGYQHIRYESAPAGADSEDGQAAALARTYFDVDITKDIEFEAEYKIQFGIPDVEDAYHHALATVSVELTDVLDLNVSFVWDRVESPQRDSDGDIPKRNDFRMTVGLEVDF
jgi:putative salt-induced outer membrane protein YdiY